MKKLLILISLFSGCLQVGMAQGRIPSETVIKHNAYTIYFNFSIIAPDSCVWNLNKEMLTCSKVVRVDKFKQDPQLAGSPKPSDFIQLPTYDPKKNPSVELAKGHLFSYEDAMCNPTNNIECFYTDQMYSQYQQFNAGDWKTVEAYERMLAQTQNIHVIAGYIGIAQKLKTGIPIVSYMYKAILHGGKYECWIMPNLPTTKGHKADYWHVTTTELDSKTGLKL